MGGDPRLNKKNKTNDGRIYPRRGISQTLPKSRLWRSPLALWRSLHPDTS